jgi:hypothetical protein
MRNGRETFAESGAFHVTFEFGNHIYTVELFRDLWLYKALGLYILTGATLIIIIIIISIIDNNESNIITIIGLPRIGFLDSELILMNIFGRNI